MYDNAIKFSSVVILRLLLNSDDLSAIDSSRVHCVKP